MLLNRRPPSRLASERGVSMIESLLATFLLSIALLGAASVQTNSMKQSSAVTVQTQADVLARQMLERMRTNPAGVISGSYNAVTATVANPNCIATSGGCLTGAATAQTDINAWYAALGALPGATGSITGGGPGTRFTVTVNWVENSTRGDADATQTWSLSSTLP